MERNMPPCLSKPEILCLRGDSASNMPKQSVRKVNGVNGAFQEVLQTRDRLRQAFTNTAFAVEHILKTKKWCGKASYATSTIGNGLSTAAGISTIALSTFAAPAVIGLAAGGLVAGVVGGVTSGYSRYKAAADRDEEYQNLYKLIREDIEGNDQLKAAVEELYTEEFDDAEFFFRAGLNEGMEEFEVDGGRNLKPLLEQRSICLKDLKLSDDAQKLLKDILEVVLKISCIAAGGVVHAGASAGTLGAGADALRKAASKITAQVTKESVEEAGAGIAQAASTAAKSANVVGGIAIGAGLAAAAADTYFLHKLLNEKSKAKELREIAQSLYNGLFDPIKY